MTTETPVINELLRACNALGIEWRADEANPDGPWHAQCPVCKIHSGLDERPLTITAAGHLRCAHHCDPQLIAAEFGLTVDRDAREATTWAPVELKRALNGETDEPPSMLARTDGRCLLYAARIHGFNAEPEALKTWLAAKATAEGLRDFQTVLYIDFEDSASSIVRRLQNLGARTDAILSDLIYIRPDEPLTAASMPDLDQAIARSPVLAVIDGVTEAFSRQGLNPLDNSDIATWLDVLPRRLARSGAAVVLIDHVVKDREQRGRWAIGGQHKLAGIDVAYSLRVIEPFGRGRDGLVAIKVEKDRPGRIREYAPDGQVALLRAQSLPDGGVRLHLDPPEPTGAAWRPTVLMERVSRAVEADPGQSKSALRDGVKGKTDGIYSALTKLIDEGFVDVRREKGTHRHHSIKPYREDEDPLRDPVTQPVPDRDLSRGDDDRDPVSPARSPACSVRQQRLHELRALSRSEAVERGSGAASGAERSRGVRRDRRQLGRLAGPRRA